MKAQSGLTWAADALLGGALIRGGDLHTRGSTAERIAASVRKEWRHGVGVDAEVGNDWFAEPGGSERVCLVSNNSSGGCRSDFLYRAGPSLLVGGNLNPWNLVEARVNVGMATYSVEGTQLGAPVAAFDVALVPVSLGFGIVVGGQESVLSNYRGVRLTTAAFHVGVRLHPGN